MLRKLKHNRLKFIFIPLIIIIAGILINAARVQYTVMRMHGQITQDEQQIESLKHDNASLLNLIESSLNDPVKIEREARARLNLKKPDEQEIILIPKKEETVEGQATAPQDKRGINKPFFIQWWDTFLKGK